MKAASLTAVLIVLMPGIVLAEKLGDHPAVVVQRLQASAGYDYESKFYPHPAWFFLSAEAPASAPQKPEESIAGGRAVQAPPVAKAEPSDAAGGSAIQAVAATPGETRR